MTKSSSNRFNCSGRFLSFAPGKKSPYQYVVLEVAFASSALKKQDADTQKFQVKLGKSLRQMIFTYLEPHDWVSVEGKYKLDSSSGEVTWKASDIIKLSPKQIEKVKAKAAKQKLKGDRATKDLEKQEKRGKSKQKSAKPARVLICQKSSCRKRGSMAVSQAVEDALAEMGCEDKVTVKHTGCMSHCKAGPNVVVLPKGGSYKRVKPKDARSLLENVV